MNTGNFSFHVFEGVHILRYRQSSLISLVPNIMSPKTASCLGLGPKSLACLTPSHFSTGWGAFHLRFPTGGAANGTPLNTLTPEQSMPSSVPLAVCTCGAVCAAAPIYAAASMIIDRIVFFILIIVLFSYKNYFTLHSQQAIGRRNGLFLVYMQN